MDYDDIQTWILEAKLCVILTITCRNHLKRSSSLPIQTTKITRNEPTCAASDNAMTYQDLSDLQVPKPTFTINKATFLVIVSLLSILLPVWRKAYTQLVEVQKENECLLLENDKTTNRNSFPQNRFQTIYMKSDDLKAGSMY